MAWRRPARHSGPHSVLEGPGSDHTVADAGGEKRSDAGLPRLWRGGSVRGGSASGHARWLQRAGGSAAKAANEIVFRRGAESHRAQASVGEQAAAARLVSWNAGKSSGNIFAREGFVLRKNG